MDDPSPPVSAEASPFVYVDPKNQKVIGPVEWGSNGLAKPLPMVLQEKLEEEEPPSAAAPRRGRRPGVRKPRTYPWGTLRSAEGMFGKKKESKVEHYQPLDDAIAKAVKEPFWD
ncbi:MAG: hypothetical protein V1926_04730 [Candidatus Peregrinibacteria bacterium]